MGSVSRAWLIAAALALAPGAFAQDVPDQLIGITGATGYVATPTTDVLESGLSDATPAALAAQERAGTGNLASRHDHVHPSEVLPLGDANQCYKVNAAGNGVTWGDCAEDAAGLSDNIPAAVGVNAPGPGTADEASRGDHVHAVAGFVRPSELPAPATATPLVESGSGAAGSSAAFARGDHVHPAAAVAGLPYATGTSPDGDEGAAGNANTVSRGDHRHADQVTAFGSVIRTVGTANHAGTMGSAARVDHVHADHTVLPAFVNATDAGKVLSPAEASGLEWEDPHTVIMDGLPGISGQAGKVLTVNSGATGVEWTDKGGGSSGGGSGCSLVSQVSSSNRTSVTVDWTAGEPLLIRNGGDHNFRMFPAPATGGNSSVYTQDGNTSRNAANVQRSSANIISTTNLNGWEIFRLTCGGGSGGGSSGPSIPTPSGAHNFLRVDAAGTAYELESGFDTSGQVPSTVGNAPGAAGTVNHLARRDHVHGFKNDLLDRLALLELAFEDEHSKTWATETSPATQGGWLAVGTQARDAAAASQLSYGVTPGGHIITSGGGTASGHIFMQYRIPRDRAITGYRVVYEQRTPTSHGGDNTWRAATHNLNTGVVISMGIASIYSSGFDEDWHYYGIAWQGGHDIRNAVIQFSAERLLWLGDVVGQKDWHLLKQGSASLTSSGATEVNLTGDEAAQLRAALKAWPTQIAVSFRSYVELSGENRENNHGCNLVYGRVGDIDGSPVLEVSAACEVDYFNSDRNIELVSVSDSSAVLRLPQLPNNQTVDYDLFVFRAAFERAE